MGLTSGSRLRTVVRSVRRVEADADDAALDRRIPVGVAVVTLFAAALAAGFGVVAGFGHPEPWAIPALAVVVAVTEMSVISFPVGRQSWNISLTDVALALVLVLAPGAWVSLALAAGVAVAQLLRRKSAPKIVFNACSYAASVGAAAVAVHYAVAAGVPALSASAVGVAAYWVVQLLLVSRVVATSTHRPSLRLIVRMAPASFVHTAASASIGLLAAWLVQHAAAGLIGLVVPLILLWSSFDQTSRRAAEARLFAELARGQEQAGGGSVDVSAQVVVTTAARLLGGADVSLLLFASDGIVRYDGDEHGAPRRERVPVTTMQEPWIPEVLSAGVVLGSVDGAATCGMRIGPAERPLALLHARRPVGSGSFTRRDAALARVLVGQAETWLSVADLAASRDAALDRVEVADEAARALGDLGASTAPALSALRESAGRLARLAGSSSSNDSVDDIVDELRSVEQAVASLLGAIALAADPDLSRELDDLHGLAAAASPAPAPRTSDDWTSTGVLP